MILKGVEKDEIKSAETKVERGRTKSDGRLSTTFDKPATPGRERRLLAVMQVKYPFDRAKWHASGQPCLIFHVRGIPLVPDLDVMYALGTMAWWCLRMRTFFS